ncbi:MAG: glutathione-disulfide reductase [Alphaproteobacteria bacterium]
MADYDYDLFVIGAGSGGVRAARIAAGHGARVAIAESWKVGGTCVLRGCVPKKLLVYGAHFGHDFEDAAAFGWTVDGARHDWPTLIANKDRELDRLNGIYLKLLANAGVELIMGRATVADPHTVQLADRQITAAYILVAVGGWPFKPHYPGIEHAITSNEALDLARFPKRIAIAGGGYIAVEFAGIFNALGAEVTQVYRGHQILRGFDEDVRQFLATELTKKGVTIRCGVHGARIDRKHDCYVYTLSDGTALEVDEVMYATGRRPNTPGLGLEAAGVALAENGAIEVDAESRSSVPSIYAVGDVTDRIALTPVAIAEGHAFADTVFGGKPRTVDHDNVASAVFSQPPVASVGLAEHEARERGFAVTIYKADFRPMKYTLGDNPERSLMKLVVDKATDRVLGAHMVGVDAAEIIQGIAIAVKMGATKADFDATIGIHPTAAEEFVTMRTPAG